MHTDIYTSEIRAFLFVYLRLTTAKVLKCRIIVKYNRNMILQFWGLQTLFALFAYSAIIYHVNLFITTFICLTNICIPFNMSYIYIDIIYLQLNFFEEFKYGYEMLCKWHFSGKLVSLSLWYCIRQRNAHSHSFLHIF